MSGDILPLKVCEASWCMFRWWSANQYQTARLSWSINSIPRLDYFINNTPFAFPCHFMDITQFLCCSRFWMLYIRRFTWPYTFKNEGRSHCFINFKFCLYSSYVLFIRPQETGFISLKFQFISTVSGLLVKLHVSACEDACASLSITGCDLRVVALELSTVCFCNYHCFWSYKKCHRKCSILKQILFVFRFVILFTWIVSNLYQSCIPSLERR